MELLIANILKYCKRENIKPTNACIEAGVGKSFISSIRSGKVPSVAKVVDLAAYLNCTTSDLVGDNKQAQSPQEVFAGFVEQLSPEQVQALADAIKML